MTFDELQVGDVFQIDGAPYEAFRIGERIVLAYVLQPTNNFDTRYPLGVADNYVDTTLERQPDPNDIVGDQYLSTAFSDLRFNANNATEAELAILEELKALL